MDGPFRRFFVVVSNPASRTMRLASGLVREYMLYVPLECTLITREGRTYEVTIRGNAYGVAFHEGWFEFVVAENIQCEYYVSFERNSLNEFVVTVYEEDGIERTVENHFTLEIKKTHVDRALLPIPIHFWRAHVVGQYDDLTRGTLVFDDVMYEVEIVEGHGKVLMQNGRAREFVNISGIAEGSKLTFYSYPDTHVGFVVHVV
ncbi:Unknown protein [Striga hermonthica]|uniref:TF-B3 domain-containing protein n=1 Tax=Striga hermonthica TaxID=68872 RepID=A0A9N7RSG5_STRHE|nr:Unknown protein [Striga hermonthica]